MESIIRTEWWRDAMHVRRRDADMTRLPWWRRWKREEKARRPERIRRSRAERRKVRMWLRLANVGL
jgi:hypothetical protein